MKDIEIEARALVLEFMHPVDELHNYPMCFDTAKQCAIISINKILLTNPTIKGTSKDLVTQIVQTKAYYYRLQDEIKKL